MSVHFFAKLTKDYFILEWSAQRRSVLDTIENVHHVMFYSTKWKFREMSTLYIITQNRVRTETFYEIINEST